MSLATGTRLGAYEITGPLGSGGMGEVYRATDSRLKRQVAIKILPGALASDPERLARFQREAEVLASLNHPHIAAVYGLEDVQGSKALVMELVEGPTLADRIAQRRIPIDEALLIARQIAAALEAAHDQGIIHRDLKPANVKVREDGTVKVLDFGLAKLSDAAGASRSAFGDPSQSPTVTAAAATGIGVILGTAAYMSPEQARGRPVDKRTDVWAFGAVLYEMLTRRRAFEGEDITETMAAVVKSTPDWGALPKDVPPQIVTLIQECLEKDRNARIGDMAVPRFLLSGHAAVAPSRPASIPGWAWLAFASVCILATVAASLALLAFRRADAAPGLPAFRFEIPTTPTDDPSTALSPDGTQLAFIANQDRVPMLWVRSLDAIENRALPGTEGASVPFWSPDGRTLGFFAGDKLKRIDVAGGMPLVIADAPNARGGAWHADGVILFVSGVNAPIMRVPARGGPVGAVTAINTGSGPSHRLPQFLPDGTRFIFTSTLGTEETNGVYLGSLDKTPPVRILQGDTGGRFAAPDRLLAIRQGALRAYSFDPETAAVQGEPVVIAQGFGGAASITVFATSDTGVLAYRAGTAQRRQLVWVSRQGAVLREIGDPETDSVAAPELSADEQSVLVFRQPTGDNDIWVIELSRNLGRRVTDGQPADGTPLWDPDGQHVVFNSQRFGGGPTRQAVNGGKAEPLFTNGENGVVLSWTRDRRYLLLRRESATSRTDLIAVTIGGESREIVVAQSLSDETEGQFSPDGRWVAFVSNDSGRAEVFVQSFPDGQARTQVSTTGGTQVRWSADGREIFYVAQDGRMMAVSIALNGTSPEVERPVPLFQTHLGTGTNVLGYKPQYAVSRDGRFLLNTAIESARAPIVVAVNWMKTLAGVGR